MCNQAPLGELPRLHTERRGAVNSPLPFPSTTEHSAFVRRAYAEAHAGARAKSSDNPYALLPDTLAFLSVLLDETQPRTIVEFGSGESTQVFARWAARHGGRLVSVEHDRVWVGEVERRLEAESRPAVRMVHAPLRLTRRGLRAFLSYGALEQVARDVAEAKLFMLDGPHMSGREVVLYFVLSHCSPGATIVVDDYRHYAVRDMLLGVPTSLARCFVGEPIDDNSHGIYVLRCESAPMLVEIPSLGARAVARSVWRCLRDYRQYGAGD